MQRVKGVQVEGLPYCRFLLLLLFFFRFTFSPPPPRLVNIFPFSNWIVFAYLDGTLIGLLKPMRFISFFIFLSMAKKSLSSVNSVGFSLGHNQPTVSLWCTTRICN